MCKRVSERKRVYVNNITWGICVHTVPNEMFSVDLAVCLGTAY